MIYKDQVAALVSDVCYGLNGTCFAYGMTGAGKTHTMLGVLGDKNEKGLIYLAVDDTVYSMAQKRTDFVLKLSYLEIYNEHVRDLLAQGGNLMVVEDPNKGVIIPNLQEFQITSSSDAKVLIDTGNLARVMASTAANQFSTRSHAVLQLVLEQVTKSSNPSSQFTTVLTSKLCLIDLAGSERAASTENRGQRMVEGANINRSLLALGNCINILSDSSKRGKFIPYRDSKLTRILKESLCGNTQTIMIACISPAHSAVEETLNTLKYAERARNIKNKVTQNTKEVETHNLEYKEIINNLKNEIEMLKNQLKNSEEVSIEKEPLQSEDLEDISNKIMNNFEEHWEIKKSIREIEILNEENTAKMKKLIGKYQSEDLSSKELRAIKHELIFLKQSIKENEEARSELLENLYVNLKAKSNLQQTMSILKKDDKREILELQIMLRNLKLEALDLHFQNSQIKQEAQKNKEESQAKDLIINKMKQEIEDMRKQISTMTAPSFNNTQVDEFTASFNFSKVSLEESPTVKQFLLSPKASEKKITLSKLEEARRARKEVRNSGKEEKTCENFPDKLRAYSVSNNFKALEEKPVQKSSKGAFSNIYQIESMKDRYKSVERHRTPTQREEEMKKAAAKHVVQQKSQSNISHLLKGMNVKLLTTNEANELVKNSWNSKKKTPAVAISLRK
jgi:kinesin family protein 18/19